MELRLRDTWRIGRRNTRSASRRRIAAHYDLSNEFWANVDAIRGLGYPEEFIRTWDFYFCYCAGGFLEQQIGVAQLLLARAACRCEPILPPLG